MKLKSLAIAFVAMGVLAGLAYVGQQTEPVADKMAVAAQKFLDSLTEEQKAKATFTFNADERTNWHFFPMLDKKRQPTRKGLGLYEMTDKQKKLALELLGTGTSSSGKEKAVNIMMLESILDKLEKGGRSVRDDEWYFVAIFGTPSKTGEWGWRLEGHHLSLNYTIDGGKIVSATPAFFGANPAVVMSGKKEGLETLPDCENLARELFRSLKGKQKEKAYQTKNFPEPVQGSAQPKVGDPVGLPASEMNAKQKKLLNRLLKSYAYRMPPVVAEVELNRLQKAGIDKIHFAYTGGAKPRQPHTYRIQGPTFVIEFLNTQPDPAGNASNHIHSVWRRIGGDFGV